MQIILNVEKNNKIMKFYLLLVFCFGSFYCFSQKDSLQNKIIGFEISQFLQDKGLFYKQEFGRSSYKIRIAYASSDYINGKEMVSFGYACGAEYDK